MTHSAKKKLLVLLDAHAILHRSYHALPHFTSAAGEPTGALYGFSAILLKIIKELKPDYIAACYDMPAPTFRHIAYEKYKAKRPKVDSELIVQINRSKDILKAFQIPIFELSGFEADDILGTIVKETKNERNLKTVIASGDLDALQLVKGNKVVVYTLKKGISDTAVYNEENFKKRYNLSSPKTIVDFKALMGDPSDNIPGVKGIGEKTAKELLQKFGSLEKIYESLERDEKNLKREGFKKRVIELLKNQKKEAFFSKALAQIRDDVPLAFDLALFPNKSRRLKKDALKAFEELGFKSLAGRLDDIGYFFSDITPLSNMAYPINGQKLDFKESLKEAKEYFWLLNDRLEIRPLNQVVCALKNGQIFQFTNSDIEKEKIFFKNIFKSGKHYAFNVKDLRHYFEKLDLIPEFNFDAALAAWLLNSEMNNPSLVDVFRVSGIEPRALDGKNLFELREKLLKKLEKEELLKVFNDIEMPLIKILTEMERTGILIDTSNLKKLSLICDKKLKNIEVKIRRLAGENFNINSTKELRRVLFEKLQIETKGIRKTEGGVRSTKFSELVKIKDKHPIIKEIISYRELAKLKSTYIDALPLLVDKNSRLHTIFNQTGTVTGRISSASPNLQNIPAKGELAGKIRASFIAPQGCKLVSFDYSQIELRIAAVLSGDAKMKRAFAENQDIHSLTASEIFNTPLEEVSPEMRRRAKIINFGILYGMGVRALSENLGVSREEAEMYKNAYFSNFEGVAKYFQNIIEEAREKGYAQTIFGRKRYFKKASFGSDFAMRETERMAVNMPIQGCLPHDVRILTFKGYMTIGELYNLTSRRKPKYVWDGTQWKKYSVLNRGKARLAKLMLKNGQTLKCDVRHIVLAVTDEGYKWKTFNNLKVGDKICCSLPKPIEFQTLPVIKFHYRSSVRNGVDLDIKSLDNNFWYWIGYYYKDGWIEKKVTKNNYERFILNYVFGYQEKEMLEKCKKYFTQFSFKPLIRKMPPTTSAGYHRFVMTIESRGLGLLFKKLGILNAAAKTKRLPKRIFSESLANRRSFIKGVLDSNGWYGRNSRVTTTIHLCQKELLEDIHLLLKTIGIPSKIRGPYTHKNKGKMQIFYRLNIPRSFMFENILGIVREKSLKIGLTTPKFIIKAFICEYPNLSKKFFFNNSDYAEYTKWKKGGSCSIYFFDQFIKKYNLKFKLPLYDASELTAKKVLRKIDTTYTLSVDDTHRFDSEGIISKNTAADIIKIAMIKIEEFLDSNSALKNKVKMILQIHDELLFEIKEEVIDEAIKNIKDIMEAVFKDAIKMPVETSIGKNWGEL